MKRPNTDIENDNNTKPNSECKKDFFWECSNS